MLSKQEEMLLYVEQILIWAQEPISVGLRSHFQTARDIFNYLHSQGVVVKVERELPLLVKSGLYY